MKLSKLKHLSGGFMCNFKGGKNQQEQFRFEYKINTAVLFSPAWVEKFYEINIENDSL